MNQIRLSNPLQNWLITLLNYAMVIAFAMTFAYWVWVFLKPSPTADIPPSSTPTQTIVPSIQAGHWFSSTELAIAPIIAPAPNIKLVGVFSSTAKRPGFAIFQLENGKQQHAIESHEIVAGVQLMSVNRNSVTVMQNGTTSEIKLVGLVETEKASQATGANVLAQPAPPPPAATDGAKPFNIQEMIQKSNLGNR